MLYLFDLFRAPHGGSSHQICHASNVGLRLCRELIHSPMALSIRSVPVLLVSGPLLFALTLANAAELPTNAGRLQIVSGEVILSVNNDRREARVNDTLKPGVRVTTGANSSAVLEFPDGQIIALQSNTSFLIAEYKFIERRIKRSKIVFSLCVFRSDQSPFS